MTYQKSKLLTEYIDYLANQQCVSKATIGIRKKRVNAFLCYLDKNGQLSNLFKLSTKTIHDYIIITARPLHRASKKHLTSSIRSFLKFAHIKGYLKKDLIEAVPVIPTRKLDRLPQSITWEAVKTLLTMPDRNTHAGRRDFAVLLLLASYGVRIGQVTTLQLQDIHWEEGFIYFAASKHGNALRLPLHQEIAEALLQYIKKDRMTAHFSEVFLTVRNPQHPLSRHNHYYSVLQKYYAKANLNSSTKGSRIIRHAFATRLVEQNIPMKTISDLLGHRFIETTFIYTKVNVSQLQELARDWPEVA